MGRQLLQFVEKQKRPGEPGQLSVSGGVNEEWEPFAESFAKFTGRSDLPEASQSPVIGSFGRRDGKAYGKGCELAFRGA